MPGASNSTTILDSEKKGMVIELETNNNQGAGGAGATGGSDELFGTWDLNVNTPFGQHTATLTLARGADGSAAPAGDIKSQLGNAALAGIEISGGNLEADISIHLQGRDFAARLSAEVSGNAMSGKIKVRDMPIAPALKFTGTKQ